MATKKVVMRTNEFEGDVKPFLWVENQNWYSICLNASEYKNEIFQSRQEEGFEGNGYDWASLAKVFLDEKIPELKDVIKFDPEAGMFSAYSSDQDALKKFAIAFKAACEDDKLIQDLFSRAELD